MNILALIAAAVVIYVGGSYGCAAIPSSDRAKHAAENIGMHSVRVTDRSPAFGILGGCHDNDLTKFTVRGTTADGVQRTLEVCAPLIGGYTVRN